MEAKGAGGYAAQAEPAIGSGHGGEGIVADQDVGPHPGVPDIALHAPEAWTIQRGPDPPAKDRQGQVKQVRLPVCHTRYLSMTDRSTPTPSPGPEGISTHPLTC